MMESEQTVRIPLEEYTRLHELDLLESRKEMYEQSQTHADNLQRDLDRYKEKHAQLQKQLARTQKQLDRFLQLSKTKKTVLGDYKHPTNLGPPKETEQEDFTSRDPCSVTISSGLIAPSHGHLSVKSNLVYPNKEPIGLSYTGKIVSPQESPIHSISSNSVDYNAPGVSAELLKRLVKDNLRMRHQIRDLETALGVSKKDSKAQSSKQTEKLPTPDSLLDSGKRDTNIHVDRIRNMDATLMDQYRKERDDAKNQLEQTSLRLEVVSREREELASKNCEGELFSLRQELEKAWKIRQSLSNELKKAQDDKEDLIKKCDDLQLNFDQLSKAYFLSSSHAQPARPPRSAPHTAPVETTGTQFMHFSTTEHPPPIRPRSTRLTASSSSTPPASFTGYATAPVNVPPRRMEPVERSRDTTPPIIGHYVCPRCDMVMNDKPTYKAHIQVCLRS